jgi:DMSO/TMAO reductase YedYZ molybdopterin-dependent catalytic subunit
LFGMDRTKTQHDRIPAPENLPADVIVSPDARRANRIPPGQSRTKKWPVLDASGPPQLDLLSWRFRIGGLVGKEVEWNWDTFVKFPRVRVFSDFHCVTAWSRLGNLWEGPSTRDLIAMAGGAKPEARFVLVHGNDRGWTTNLPLEDFLAEDALVAILHDGESLSLEHGGPARMIVPRLYAWKSAKWIAGIELLAEDRPGFWEANGYHMRGDPWTEERYGY